MSQTPIRRWAIDNSYISDVENGNRIPKADFLLKVADIFEVTVDQLLRDELDV
jgi:transcriptional regulator with XRE-family HTH domain